MANELQMLAALASQIGFPAIPPPARPMPMMLPTNPLPPLPQFSEPMPTPPPIAPMGGLDQGLIAQYAGPPPVNRPPSTLDKIAAVLSGISQGPQYGLQLREQLQRPQREYQSRRLAGVEAATQKQAREQAQLQSRADIQSERDFQQFMANRTFASQAARDQAEQAFRLELMTRQRDAELAEQRRRERAQQERDARLIARDYGKLTDNPKIAQELGRYYAGLTDNLSPAAARFESAQARIAEARARRAAGGPSDPLAGISVETEMGVIPLKAYAALKDVLGPPKRFIMPGGGRAGVGVGGQFTIQDAQAQVKAMEGAQKSPAEINAVIDAMIKDNPKMSLQLQSLKKAPALTAPQPSSSIVGGTARAVGGAVSGTVIPALRRAAAGANKVPYQYIPVN